MKEVGQQGEGGRGRLVGPSGPKGRMGQLGQKLKKSIQNKNWIFEFTKALEICTRRFRRNFDTRIFPKFFYTSHEFLENTICCAMNTTLVQIKLRKSFSWANFSKIQSNALLAWQRFYDAKSGYYKISALALST
jgi:hypothetical protein